MEEVATSNGRQKGQMRNPAINSHMLGGRGGEGAVPVSCWQVVLFSLPLLSLVPLYPAYKEEAKKKVDANIN